MMTRALTALATGAALAFTAFVGSTWSPSARADLAGATVAGSLEFPGHSGNYFDPAMGYVPAGYGNSLGPTVVLSGTGNGNFAFLQGGGTVVDPGIDSWLAEFNGSQLTVAFRILYHTDPTSGATLTFKSAAFVGQALVQMGSDAFLNSGNGGMMATLVGDTITLSVAPQCGPCNWPLAVYANTYSLTPALIDRGNGMIYDPALNVTWLQDMNYAKTSGYDVDGLMSWHAAMEWSENLVYGGFHDWRLPTILDTGAPGCDWGYYSTDCGHNVQTASGGVTYSEMAHLWYVTLGNKSYYYTSGASPQPGWGFQNKGPFLNAQPAIHWSGTEYALDPSTAWGFDTDSGGQDVATAGKGSEFFAWAVRDGDAFDATPPAIAPQITGVLGNNGWYVSNVVIAWTVSDEQTVISESTGCEAASVTADTTGVTFTCSATSQGGTTTESVTIRRDATPPTATATADPPATEYGWRKQTVTVSFTGTDTMSGGVTCDGQLILATEGAGQSASGRCYDSAGNQSDLATASGINIDKTNPTVLIVSPVNGAVYQRNEVVIASYSCDDALSGIASCVGTVENGQPIDTSKKARNKKFTVEAIDKAGNKATASVTFSVL